MSEYKEYNSPPPFYKNKIVKCIDSSPLKVTKGIEYQIHNVYWNYNQQRWYVNIIGNHRVIYPLNANKFEYIKNTKYGFPQWL